MDKRSDDIRQDIEQTRASLDEKIDLLQNKASEAVEQTRQIFDVSHQVAERPWVALGAAAIAGYVLGTLGEEKQHATAAYTAAETPHAYSAPKPSPVDAIKDKGRDVAAMFDDEIEMLKLAAMTTLTGFLREAAIEAVPALRGQIEKLMGQSDERRSAAPGYARSTSPGSSMASDTSAARINNDAIPSNNLYGSPPTPTEKAEHEGYYRTYQPDEDERAVGHTR
ncbi:DUF3618 domain-containing protein [Chloroflexia bacterium SDU3-3]|nr:DUF3618 domain-containing protein [Chloroflexia bacterium SDU3-3]